VLIEDYIRQLRDRGLTDTYHLLTDIASAKSFKLLAEGRSNKEVAVLLVGRGLDGGDRTARGLMEKLNLHNNRREYVLYAVRQGIIH
jgi:hypothetical protein